MKVPNMVSRSHRKMDLRERVMTTRELSLTEQDKRQTDSRNLATAANADLPAAAYLVVRNASEFILAQHAIVYE